MATEELAIYEVAGDEDLTTELDAVFPSEGLDTVLEEPAKDEIETEFLLTERVALADEDLKAELDGVLTVEEDLEALAIEELATDGAAADEDLTAELTLDG